MDFLEFKHEARTYTCRAASSPATPNITWWWLAVSTESQRYAAFRTAKTDTPENLRRRIQAYYAQLLIDRARPPEVRGPWGRRTPPTPAANDKEPG